MKHSRNSQERGDLPKVDDIDREIIAVLQSDGRRSFTRLAQQIGVSESVVRYRVQRMDKKAFKLFIRL